MRGSWNSNVWDLIEAKGHKGKKGPEGRALCWLCGVEIPKGSRKWCKDRDCENMRNRLLGGPRRYVQDLPPECAECGLDVVALAKRIDALARRGSYIESGYKRSGRRRADRVLRDAGFNPNVSLWDADHIIPLDEGGKDEPDNIQRLCVPCHKAKTKEQAGRRGRRGKKQTEIFLLGNPGGYLTK